MTLIDESPEAQFFVKTASSSFEKFKRFPSENFSGVTVGIMATSAVDSQGECMDSEALDLIVEQIRKHSLWVMYEHNPLVPPLGRVLAAKRLYAAESDIYFVASVTGLYDPDAIPGFAEAGIDLGHLAEVEPNAEPTEAGEFKLEYSPHEIPFEIVQEMLSTAPPSIQREPKYNVRKSADPQAILTLAVALHFVLAPFSKKFLERFGDRAFDGCLSTVSWLKETVFERFSRLAREPLFVFATPYRGCAVQFVVPSKDPKILAEATDSVHLAGESACALISSITTWGPEKVVYKYDATAKLWIPLYVATRSRGVIADKRYLIALDRLRPPNRTDAVDGP